MYKLTTLDAQELQANPIRKNIMSLVAAMKAIIWSFFIALSGKLSFFDTELIKDATWIQYSLIFKNSRID